jgi:hypothetical protein
MVGPTALRPYLLVAPSPSMVRDPEQPSVDRPLVPRPPSRLEGVLHPRTYLPSQYIVADIQAGFNTPEQKSQVTKGTETGHANTREVRPSCSQHSRLPAWRARAESENAAVSRGAWLEYPPRHVRTGDMGKDTKAPVHAGQDVHWGRCRRPANGPRLVNGFDPAPLDVRGPHILQAAQPSSPCPPAASYDSYSSSPNSGPRGAV